MTYKNAILPLAVLEAQQFPLVQSCVFQKMVGTTDDVRKASAEAEKRIDVHLLTSRFILSFQVEKVVASTLESII